MTFEDILQKLIDNGYGIKPKYSTISSRNACENFEFFVDIKEAIETDLDFEISNDSWTKIKALIIASCGDSYENAVVQASEIIRIYDCLFYDYNIKHPNTEGGYI